MSLDLTDGVVIAIFVGASAFAVYMWWTSGKAKP